MTRPPSAPYPGALGGLALTTERMRAPEVVIYAPDKGAGYGQSFKARKIAGAWESLNAFLANPTTSSPTERPRLVVYRATKWDDDAVAEGCIRSAIERFGDPHRQETTGEHHGPLGNHRRAASLSGTSVGKRCLTWQITSSVASHGHARLSARSPYNTL